MSESYTPDPIKSIFASKTFWVNILGPIFTFLATKYGLDVDSDTQMQIVLIVMAIANIVIRRFTKTPVVIVTTTPKPDGAPP